MRTPETHTAVLRPAAPARETAVEKLVAKLDRYEEAYRVGKPIVSDRVFDAQMDRLRELDPRHPRLKKIGAARGRRAPKERLPIIVGSLDKLRPGDVAGWMSEMSKKQAQQAWLVEPKFDGQSITLRYINASMERGWSRGRDGAQGQNVTAAVRYIQGVRSALKETSLFDAKQELLVRGEVVMHRSIFRDHYENRDSDLGRTYKNPRNLVCGLTNRIDPEPVAEDLKRCTFVALQIFCKVNGKWRRPSSAHREWVYLQLLGLTTALHPARYAPGNAKLAKLVREGHTGLKKILPVHPEHGSVGHLAYWYAPPTEEEVKQRFYDIQKALDIYIDGLVVQPVDNGPWQNAGDHVTPRPSFVKSIKLDVHDQETMDTEVGSIEWNVSKRGLLKPRLILKDAVVTNGVEVNHATCNNARYVVAWGLRPGRPIRVVRSGDVIPRIVGVKTKSGWVKVDVKDAGVKDPKVEASLPKTCPSCGAGLRWNQNKVDLLCLNPKCSGSHGKSVLAFFRLLGVDDVASGTVADLIEAGLNTVPKILAQATPQRLEKLEGFAAKKAAIVSRSIAGALKDVPLHQVMHASGCFQNETFSLGGSRLQEIIGELGPGMVERATQSELRSRLKDLKGLGPAGLNLFVDAIARWRKFYAAIRSHHSVTAGPKTLNGVTVAFTGFRDAELQAMVIRNGGRVAGVSKKCNVLFAASLGSTKCKRADELGIPVVAQSDAKRWLSERIGK